ncbi:malate dehydrogenase [Archaeoglobus sp.]
MKLGFVGAGRVGSTSAFTCLLNLDVDEIALVDIAEDLAVGEAMDLSHAAAGIDKYPKIVGGSDYSLLKGSEIIVVTAGLARKPGMTRLDLATKNAGIIKDVAKKIVEASPESKILVVTNPMDVMTYIMWKESGKPRNEVFGMGNLLDSQRLKERLHAAGARNIRRAWIIGEHGDSMFVAKSLADFDGEVDWEAVEKDTRFVAAEVIKRKGATIFGPAVAIYRMVKAVVEDTGEIIPTSVVLQGEYGIENVAVGVPTKLSKNGAEIVEMDLTEEEMNNLKNSARILRERLSELGY